MWAVQYLPEWVIHLTFIAGVVGVIAGFVLGFIPLINKYKLPVQIISIIVLVLGVYLEGGLADNKIWQQRAAALEVKVKEAEAKSAEKSVEYVDRIVEKTKVVRERGQEIIKYVDREVVKTEEVIKFVERCPIPQDIIDTHNRAVDDLNKAAEKKK